MPRLTPCAASRTARTALGGALVLDASTDAPSSCVLVGNAANRLSRFVVPLEARPAQSTAEAMTRSTSRALVSAGSPARMPSGANLGGVTTTVPRLRKAVKAHAPNLAVEKTLWQRGVEIVVGIDEVGRGSWAGPISVGAAVVPRERRIYKIRDSKMLTEDEREALFDRVAGWCRAWAVGHASAGECDELGMSAAQRLAAQRALAGLGMEVEQVLIDGSWDFVGGANTTRIVRGDATSLSISAASILAKVTRDRIMRSQAVHYPGYDFDLNKGYPCPRHKAALQAWGPTTIHRRSWAFMDGLPWNGVPRFRRPDPQMSLFD